MGKLPARLGAGVFATCLSAGVGLGIGNGMDAQDRDVRRLHQAEAVVVERDGQIEEARRNQFRVEQKLGERCLALVSMYMPDGSLSATPEDSVVGDLVSLPDKPCGATQPETRLALRQMAGARQAVSTAHNARLEAAAQVPLARQDVQYTDVPAGAIKGGLTGAFFGMLGGFAAWMGADIVCFNRNYNRQKPSA